MFSTDMGMQEKLLQLITGFDLKKQSSSLTVFIQRPNSLCWYHQDEISISICYSQRDQILAQPNPGIWDATGLPCAWLLCWLLVFLRTLCDQRKDNVSCPEGGGSEFVVFLQLLLTDTCHLSTEAQVIILAGWLDGPKPLGFSLTSSRAWTYRRPPVEVDVPAGCFAYSVRRHIYTGLIQATSGTNDNETTTAEALRPVVHAHRRPWVAQRTTVTPSFLWYCFPS